jgi:outer membrane biosynthesis protein TonB
MRRRSTVALAVSIAVHAGVLVLLWMMELPNTPPVFPEEVTLTFGSPMRSRGNAPRRAPIAGGPPAHGNEPTDAPEPERAEGTFRVPLPGAPPRERLAFEPKAKAPTFQNLDASAPAPPAPPSVDATAPDLGELLVGGEDGDERGGVDQGEREAPHEIRWQGGVARKSIRRPAISFPQVLREEGRNAEVSARLRVSADGAVLGVEIVDGSGYASVDAYVAGVLRSYSFEEGSQPSTATVRVYFRLDSTQ